jgi:serine/threonine protein kinase/WD40 repeat protein
MAEEAPKHPPSRTTLPEPGGDTFSFLDRSIPSTADASDQVAPPAPAPPYVLRGIIGEGGQGEVWEAWQTSLHRLVALKIHRRGSRDAFIKEALLTGELDHPNIVPVLDLDEAQSGGASLPAMAMKRVRGKRWDDLIALERDHVSEAYLRRHLDILQSVCRAVSYAHARGVVHLDLKPAQVIVGEFGEVYLMDWGVAARLDRDANLPARHVSEITAPAGTPSCMAPEQALADAGSIGIATDVYLLGALVYHIACGRAPHPGDSTDRLIEAARRNEILPPCDEMPAELRRIAARAMNSSPPDRHQGAEEFRREVEEFLGSSRQRAEAEQLADSVATERLRFSAADYPELARFEQVLERAEALAPGHARARALRDELLMAHHERALKNGDLELARIVGARVEDQGQRESALARVAAAEELLRRKDAQRRRARRIAIGALTSLVAVLLGASYLLERSLKETNSERDRAERALVQSRRELARASVQAAMSHLEHQRDAEAREALRKAPAEFRGWEWGYLANAAMPEARMLRPRDDVYTTLAVSKDDSLVGAIRRRDGALVIVDPEADEGGPPLATDERTWRSVAGGQQGRILAGATDGTVARVDRTGLRASWRPGDRAIVLLAPHGDEAVLAADEAGVLRAIAEDGTVTTLLEARTKLTALATREGAIAVGGEDGSLWHAAEGTPLVRSSFAHNAPVLGFAWRPSEPQFVSWAAMPEVTQPLDDGRAAVHRLGQATPLHVRDSDGLAITAAAWSAKGDRLYLASANTNIFEHDGRTRQRLRTLLHPQGIARAMEFTRDGSQLVTYTWRTADVRSLSDNVMARFVRADSRRITGKALRENDMILCGPDGGIGLWRTDRAEHARNFQVHRERGVSLDMDEQGILLASAHQTGKVMLWDAMDPDRETVRELWFGESVTLVRLSPDGKTLAAHEEDGRLHVYTNLSLPGEQKQTWDTGRNVAAMAIAPDGSLLVAAAVEGGLVEAGIAPPRAPAPVGDGARKWSALAFQPGGDGLVAGSWDGTISLLRVPGYQSIRTFEGHAARVRRMAFVEEGRLLLSASDDESARLWDVETGECLTVYRGSQAGAVTAAFMTPDGRRVITCCMDSVVRVFDRRSAAELLALEEHQYGVLDMVLSTDGRRLFSSGQDSRLRAWFALPGNTPDDALRSGVAAFRQLPTAGK